MQVHKDLSPASKQLTVQEQSKARFALGELINRYEVVTYVTKGGEVAATGFFPAGLADGLNSDVRAAEGYGVWYTGTNEFSDVNPDYTVDQVEALQTLVEGVSVPMPSLGSLASDARTGLRSYPYQLLFPALAIFLIVLAFNLLGNGLRDAFDPKLRS